MNQEKSRLSPFRLVITGWLAMTSAFLSVPWIILSFFTTDREAAGVRAGELAVLTAGTTVFVILMVTFRRFLTETCRFGGAGGAITLLIAANVISAAVGMAETLYPANQIIAGTGLAAAVASGVLQVLFAVRLFRCPEPLYGLHRPFCLLTLVTGICVASLLFIPVGVVTSAVADVMLATIFFHAASALRREKR